MSWPVFITTPSRDVINVNHIINVYPYDERIVRIVVKHGEDGSWIDYDGTLTDVTAAIDDAIAATAKFVARAEAEAIDEHRAEIAKRSEFYTKPVAR